MRRWQTIGTLVWMTPRYLKAPAAPGDLGLAAGLQQVLSQPRESFTLMTNILQAQKRSDCPSWQTEFADLRYATVREPCSHRTQCIVAISSQMAFRSLGIHKLHQ